jgi:hypothetical protein
VTFEDLFDDAGVPWRRGVTVSYVSSDDASKESVVTYRDLTSRFFYPDASATSIDFTQEARMAPPVLAIEEHSSSIGDNGTTTASEAEQFNVEHASDGNEPRVITGITEQEARDRSARGMRLIKNLDVIVVTVVDFDGLNAAIDAAEKSQRSASSSLADAKTAFGAAIASARSVASDPDATQAQVSSALSELAAAQATFTDKVKKAEQAEKDKKDDAKQGGKTTTSKAKNTLTVKAKKVVVKLGNAKKKVIAAKNAFKVSSANGKVTYKKTKGSAKISVAKNGKVTVKKGLKPGAYVVRVKVTAAGDAKHKAASKVVKLAVSIKKQ